MQDTIEGFRLSPQQKHLWLLLQSNNAYMARCSILLEGNLDVHALEQAVSNLISRHETYRTSFHQQPGLKFPLQVVNPQGIATWQYIDLSQSDPQEQEAQITELYREETHSTFRLERSPTLHLALFSLTDQKHLLLVHLPSLLADQHTLQNFACEIADLYKGDRVSSDLSVETVQYLQFSEWQNMLLEAEESKVGREFWQQKDLSTLSSWVLPSENRRSKGQSFTPACFALPLASASMTMLQSVAEKYDSTLSTCLLACWKILLWRLTERSVFSLGMASNGRIFEELMDVAGPLAKDILISCQLAEDQSFSETLMQTAQAVHDALEWQQYFTWQDLAPASEDSDSPQSLPFSFDFHVQPAARFSSGVSFSLQACHIYQEPFKVRVVGVQKAKSNELAIEFHYNSNLFNREDIQRLASQFAALLESALMQPEAPISELNILNDNERGQLLHEFNNTRVNFSGAMSVHLLFEEQVSRSPDTIAVVEGDKQCTYADLDRRANQLAHYLHLSGVGPEVPVGICIERSIELLVGIIGILKAGGYYAPLDPTYPGERLAFMVADAHMPLLLTRQSLVEKLPNTVQIISLDTDWPLIMQQRSQKPVSRVTTDTLAYVIYTSGSTGKPKGIMVSHQGLMNYLNWCIQYYGVVAGNGSVIHSSIAFDLTVTSLFSPLLVGRRVLFAPEGQGIEPLVSMLRNEKELSLLKITPAHLDLLNQSISPDEVSGVVNTLVIGGENLLGEHLAFWRSHASSTRLINEYGPTETVVGCCIYEVLAETPVSGNVPIGHPIANTQLYLLDKRMRLVPVGVPGELYIGGSSLARGYINRPELTAEHFLANPFSTEPGTRIYRTGDLARYLPDGTLEYLGRIDDQIKVRGYRIESGEIEAVLSQHPALGESFVIAREEAIGGKYLLAYFVMKGQTAPSTEELRRYLQERVPEYMIPSHFVALKSLPLTSNGKVDRRALPPPDTRLEAGKYTIRPRSPIEEVIAELWVEVVGRKQVDIYENFFEVGGHSLLATRLIARIQAVLQVEMSVRSLFEAPTIARLARRVEEALHAGKQRQMQPIQPVSRMQELPLSYAQQRLWFLHQFDPQSTAYSIPNVVHMQGQLDRVALGMALAGVIGRHESLHTVFVARNGQPVQVIEQAPTATLQLIDLRFLPGAVEREQEMRRLAQQETEQPFDLARGPLLRSRLLQLGEQDYVLLLTLHHIISDGWSMSILVRDLIALYRSFIAGQPSPLSPLPIHYADYALWQRSWLQGEVLREEVRYWTRQLSGARALELPGDAPRPTHFSHRGDRLPFHLEGELSQGLSQLCKQEGVTLFMLLLSAFQVLLARLSGQQDIVVGTDSANRAQLETEGLIGFFVNMLALRTNLAGNPPFLQVLSGVREMVLGAYMHQELPFEMVVEHMRLERTGQRTPLVNVLFVMQNVPQVEAEMPGLEVRSLNRESYHAKFDLTLFVSESPDGLNCALNYSTDLFKRETIAALVQRYETILRSIVAQPDTRITNLEIATQSERVQKDKEQVIRRQRLKVSRGKRLRVPGEHDHQQG